MKVLVVEDRAEIAEIITRYLQPFTTEILTTITRAEAAELIRSHHDLTLITIDLGLPDSMGDETLAWIDSVRRECPDAIVVVISGIVTMEDEQRILSAGAHGFIHKLDHLRKPATFMERLSQIFRSIVKNPQRFERNVEIAEALSDRLTRYIQSQAKG